MLQIGGKTPVLAFLEKYFYPAIEVIRSKVNIKKETDKIRMQLSKSLQMVNRKNGNVPVNIGQVCQLCFKENPPGKNPNSFSLQCEKCGKFIPPETLLLPNVLHQPESSNLDLSTDSSNTMSNPSPDLHPLGTLQSQLQKNPPGFLPSGTLQSQPNQSSSLHPIESLQSQPFIHRNFNPSETPKKRFKLSNIRVPASVLHSFSIRL